MGIETIPYYSSTSRPRGSLEEFHSEELRSLNVLTQDSNLLLKPLSPIEILARQRRPSKPVIDATSLEIFHRRPRRPA
jgi:hypothetical protein